MVSFSTLEIETVCSSKTLVNFYRTIWRHIRDENLKSNNSVTLNGYIFPFLSLPLAILTIRRHMVSFLAFI
jgi:hypothetical protein